MIKLYGSLLGDRKCTCAVCLCTCRWCINRENRKTCCFQKLFSSPCRARVHGTGSASLFILVLPSWPSGGIRYSDLRWYTVSAESFEASTRMTTTPLKKRGEKHICPITHVHIHIIIWVCWMWWCGVASGSKLTWGALLWWPIYHQYCCDRVCLLIFVGRGREWLALNFCCFKALAIEKKSSFWSLGTTVLLHEPRHRAQGCAKASTFFGNGCIVRYVISASTTVACIASLQAHWCRGWIRR